MTKKFRVPLIIQEALGQGEEGIDRHMEPVTLGVPLAEHLGLKEASELGLEGGVLGQFRVLGRWPSGNIKWVLIDTLADVPAGKKNDSIALTNGKGNFGGPNLAADEGETIRVNTGVAEFVIKKRNFNLFETVHTNGRRLVAKGASKGMMIRGPAFPETICGNRCDTTYTSANDDDSTAVIEENGPVKTVIKATGYHKDDKGNSYMAFTVRMTFIHGKSYAKIKSYLRNAEKPQTKFDSSFKEFRSYQAHVVPDLGSIKSFSVANHQSTTTGSFLDEESVFLYQAYSDYKEEISWSLGQVRSFIPRTGSFPYHYSQEGYVIQKDTELLAFGSRSQYPEGWADLFDSAGRGIQVGIFHLPGYWPKAIEINQGGTEIKIGIWPKQNTVNYWQSYPQYSISEFCFNFHDTNLDFPSAEFKRLQHSLIGRAASPKYYNEAQALPYPLPEYDDAEKYHQEISKTATSLGFSSPPPLNRNNIDYKISRLYSWHDQRGSNQFETRFENMTKWLCWGTPGHYLAAKLFYLYQEEQAIPRADGFDWREESPSAWNYKGYPQRSISLHSEKETIFRPNQEHAHWWGMIYYYFLSGDEGIREAILDHKARFNNPRTQENRSGALSSRGLGNILMSQAVMYDFLSSIGDPEAQINLELGDQHIARGLLNDFESHGAGLSKRRGFHWLGGLDTGGERIVHIFCLGMLANGLYNFYKIRGKNTPNAAEIEDAIIGMANFWKNEAFSDTGNILTTGTMRAVHLDNPSNQQGTSVHNMAVLAWWAYTLTGDFSFLETYKKQLARNLYSNFILEETSNFKSLPAMATLNYKIQKTPDAISDLSVVRKKDNSLALSWTAPETAEKFIIKFCDKKIAEWLWFDNKNVSYKLDPESHTPWFSAKNVTAKPVCVGKKCSLVLQDFGTENAWHFAVKTKSKEGVLSPISNIAVAGGDSEPTAKKTGISIRRSSS